MCCISYNTYTISGLRKTLYDGRIELSNEEQLKLDRMNWVLNYIISSLIGQDLPLEHFVNIHSNMLKSIVGYRSYKQILRELQDLNFISENSSYSSCSFSKSYALSAHSISSGIVETEYFSDRFLKRLKKKRDDDYKDIVSNELFRKLMFNTSKLMVYELDLHYIIYLEEIGASKAQIDRYRAYYDTFERLSDNISPKAIMSYPIFFKPSLSEYGRVYHIAASIPKIIRASMRTMNNELIWEVDMSAAQLSLLILDWLNIQKGRLNKGFQTPPLEELRSCYNVLLSGNLYQYIRNSSESLKTLPRDKFKLEVLKALNSRTGSHVTAQEALCNVFPSFMKWVNQIKKSKGHKKVAQMGQKLESELFISTYKKIPDKVFALPIHDCILTTEENANMVKGLLLEKAKTMFPSIISSPITLTNLFKISQVSLSDENTLRWGYEMYRFEENLGVSEQQYGDGLES